MHKSHAKKGAACTEFVCDNDKLQSFVADQLDNSEKQTYTQNMKEVHEASATDGKDVVLKEHKLTSEQTVRKNRGERSDCRQSCRHHLHRTGRTVEEKKRINRNRVLWNTPFIC